jgi:hypothetical protein
MREALHKYHHYTGSTVPVAPFGSNVSPAGPNWGLSKLDVSATCVALQQSSDENIDACVLVHSLLFVRCILSSGPISSCTSPRSAARTTAASRSRAHHRCGCLPGMVAVSFDVF